MDALKVVVTGANGQIAYSFVFALGMGNVFGDYRRIDLRLYDLPGTETRLAGLRMELEDCAFPLLENISVHSDFNHASDGIDVAFLIGASPRGIGMERADLLIKNAHIFKEQGAVLNRCADSNAKIFVVGNPANTNCLIAMNHAPNLKRANFHSMMRLDQNRMQACLAQKIERSVDDIQHCVVWGNHSLKQVPDFTQAVVGKHGEDLKPVSAVIGDRDWLENVMIPTVQKRGAAVIESRGSSSAGSASRALAAAAKSLFVPVEGEWFSSGVCSDNNGYGIESDLIFSFPCRAIGEGDYEIISDLPMDNFIKSRILLSEEELIQERSTVKSL